MRCRVMKASSSASCSCATGDQLPGWRVLVLGLLPRRRRIAAVQPRRDAPELLLRRRAARAARCRADGRRRGQPFVEPQLLLELLAPEPERARAARSEVLSRGSRRTPRSRPTLRSTRRRDRRGCAGRRGREKARGRSSSMKRSVPRMLSRPTLTKMPGGSLMLSRAACIKPRHLAQLRQRCAGRARRAGRTRTAPARPGWSRGCRRSTAGCAPRCGPASSSKSRARMLVSSAGRSSRSIVGQAPRVDGGEPAGEAPRGRGPGASIACRPRSSSRSSWTWTPSKVALVGWTSCRYARYSSTKCGRGSAEYMRYNSARQSCPASSTWSPLPSATSRMSRYEPCGSCARLSLIAAEDTRRTADSFNTTPSPRRRRAFTSTTSSARARI